MAMELYINDKKIENIDAFEVRSSVTTICNSFSVLVTTGINTIRFDETSFLKFKEGEKAEIKIDDVPVVNGFIDLIEVDYDSTTHNIRIFGRDRTADFVDSSVGPLNIEGPIELESFLRLVLDSMNLNEIEIINLLPANADTEIRVTKNLSSEIGQTGFEFVNEFAKLKQVLLRGDGKGNILMTRGGGDQRIFANLINLPGDTRNNIITGKYSASTFDRYNSYTFVSQEDYSAVQADPEDGTNNSGVAIDTAIRSTRTIIIEAEENSTSEECAKRAAWEANIQRSRAKDAEIKVSGHSVFETGPLSSGKSTLWEINSIVGVVDILLNIDSKMLIESIIYKLSLSEGSITELVLVPPDSYLIEASRSAQEARTSLIGKEDD